MSSEEEEGRDSAFGFEGFSRLSARDFNSLSTMDENERLRRELDRVTRQMEVLLSLEEKGKTKGKLPAMQRQMKPVPMFSGKESKISVNDWVREVDYLIRTCQLEDDDKGALDLIERYVTGQAAKVFRGEVDKGRRYNEVLKRMQVMFGGIEYRGRDPLQIFYCRTQKENETPAEFAIELADLLGTAEREGNKGGKYPNRDKMLTDAFMGGLRDEKTIMQMRPLVAIEVPFEQIQDELLKLEYDRKRANIQGKGETSAMQNSLLKAIKEIKVELKEELRRMDSKIEEQGKEIRELKEKVEKSKDKSQGVICYKCGKSGHLSYTCQVELPKAPTHYNKGFQPRSEQTQRNVNTQSKTVTGEGNPVMSTPREQSNSRSLQG